MEASNKTGQEEPEMTVSDDLRVLNVQNFLAQHQPWWCWAANQLKLSPPLYSNQMQDLLFKLTMMLVLMVSLVNIFSIEQSCASNHNSENATLHPHPSSPSWRGAAPELSVFHLSLIRITRLHDDLKLKSISISSKMRMLNLFKMLWLHGLA